MAIRHLHPPGPRALQPRAATGPNPRALAPHVQATIGSLVQRRAAETHGAKAPAPHVQAAVGASVQCRPVRPAPPPLRLPVAQPRATVIQRDLRVDKDGYQQMGYWEAYETLIAVARRDRNLKGVLDYVEDGANNVDLEFSLGRPGGLAETSFKIGKTVIATGTDLEKYLNEQGVGNLARERLTIQIVVDPEEMARNSHRDILQTLTHEFAIHAMKYPAFLLRLREMAQQDLQTAIAYVRQEFRYGSMSGGAHHKGLIEGTDVGYSRAKELLLGTVDHTRQARFTTSETEDIHIYRTEHQMRSQIDEKSYYQVLDKANDLDISITMKTPLFRKKVTTPPPKSCRCCCFLTTACVTAKGLADDCHELTTLRAFRDGWMQDLPNGGELVGRYYEVAPRIVEWIEAQPDAATILDTLFEGVVQPTVALIEAGEEKAAFELYGSAIRQLHAAFLET